MRSDRGGVRSGGSDLQGHRKYVCVCVCVCVECVCVLGRPGEC